MCGMLYVYVQLQKIDCIKDTKKHVTFVMRKIPNLKPTKLMIARSMVGENV